MIDTRQLIDSNDQKSLVQKMTVSKEKENKNKPARDPYYIIIIIIIIKKERNLYIYSCILFYILQL